MEPLTLKPRQPIQEDIECWDDDEDLQGNFQFRNASTTTIGSTHMSYHRDSISSRMSIRSERESSNGGDEGMQLSLPTDDEISTANAIESAKSAGIPIPANVPPSALLRGTIKRLVGRHVKKVLDDDWADDLELSNIQPGGLQLKTDRKESSEALWHFSPESLKSSISFKSQSDMTSVDHTELNLQAKPADDALGKFREDDTDSFFGDVPTIKVAKNREPKKTINFLSPPPAKPNKDFDDIEKDIEFPPDGELKLSARKEVPKTPISHLHDDFDIDWAEGSLGTRFGGTRRDGRSDPSSSISAFSPSTSSCLTAESEDEGLDCLVLPDGPLKFDEVLKKRLEPENTIDAEEKPADEPAAPKDDFFSGIEIGDGEVFESKKLTLNRNIKHKLARQTSPARRTAVTLTFTNKSQPGATRIPKPPSIDRARSTLEPVSESGGPVPKYYRAQSRVGGHSSQSSVSNIPTPSTPSSHTAVPSTPSRRGVNKKSSREALKTEQTANPTLVLRNKRSMPTLRSQPSPARSQPIHPRPPSRGDSRARSAIPSRPKTPTDRAGAESSLGISRKPPIPFLPAGTSHSQSHHISIKTARHGYRPNSSDSNENVPLNRPISRLSNPHHRPTTPTGRRDHAPESLAREAASKRTLTKPTRRRLFGDGTELEVFDDLPTSASVESKFEKKPIARGAPKSGQLRSKLGLPQIHPSTPAPAESLSSIPQVLTSQGKQESMPRFARDTNSSRLAREHRTGIGSVAATLHAAPLPTVRESGPLNPVSTNWKAQIAARGLASPSAARSKRGKLPQKPRLIKPLGDGVNSAKTLKGMQWNPTLFKWEGNENALASFDAAIQPPHSPKNAASVGGPKAAPALISNVGATKGGVQVVGGMVFDPQRMCWLKMAPSQTSRHQSGTSSNPRSPDTIDQDEDPFAGLDDLDDDKDKKSVVGAGFDEGMSVGMGTKNSGDDEWLVGEEFDVGPEFVRRQRAEEDKWRKKVEGWVGKGIREQGSETGYEGEDWRWALRGKVEILPS
ncbi:hypothetical protein MMC07_005266 [Pseudocyphellaria aurata]|nr:hypothetical protein [Pseudocyphellaria aurata]